MAGDFKFEFGLNGMKIWSHCPKYEQNNEKKLQGRIFLIFFVHILANATTSYFQSEISWPLVRSNFGITKGQLSLKANCQAVDPPKKNEWTNLVFLTWRVAMLWSQMPFVRFFLENLRHAVFFGESTARRFFYDFTLPLDSIYSRAM